MLSSHLGRNAGRYVLSWRVWFHLRFVYGQYNITKTSKKENVPSSRNLLSLRRMDGELVGRHGET